jgi:hypothetical protein
MDFQLTTDYNLVREILTNPQAYEHMGDDYLVPREEYAVNIHPDIRYLIARNGSGNVGLFALFPRNCHCWELHVCMLPEAITPEKWEAARELAPWLGERTECRRLVAEVPRTNRAAIYYGTHGIGMRHVGTHPQAFMKHGKLQDLIVLGMPVGNGAVT